MLVVLNSDSFFLCLVGRVTNVGMCVVVPARLMGSALQHNSGKEEGEVDS